MELIFTLLHGFFFLITFGAMLLIAVYLFIGAIGLIVMLVHLIGVAVNKAIDSFINFWTSDE